MNMTQIDNKDEEDDEDDGWYFLFIVKFDLDYNGDDLEEIDEYGDDIPG